MQMADMLYIVLLILPFVVFAGAITDIYSYTIPNSFSIILVLGFYIFASLNPYFTWGLIGMHTLTAIGMLVVTFGLFAFGVFGGGDAKILTAICLWFGYPDSVLYLGSVMISGGLLSIALYVFRKIPPFTIYMFFQPIERLYFGPSDMDYTVPSKRAIPYGIAIAIGLYDFLPKSFVFQSVV